MAMPKSTPRRPGNPGQNRDARGWGFWPPRKPGRPAPSRRPLRPRLDAASAHDRDAAAAATRVPGTPSLAEGPRCRRGRLRIQAAPGERPSTRRCAAARDRHHPERNLPISGPAGALRVIFHTVAAHAPRGPNGWGHGPALDHRVSVHGFSCSSKIIGVLSHAPRTGDEGRTLL